MQKWQTRVLTVMHVVSFWKPNFLLNQSSGDWSSDLWWGLACGLGTFHNIQRNWYIMLIFERLISAKNLLSFSFWNYYIYLLIYVLKFNIFICLSSDAISCYMKCLGALGQRTCRNSLCLQYIYSSIRLQYLWFWGRTFATKTMQL